MEIRVREKCPDCDDGVINNPDWKPWWAEFHQSGLSMVEFASSHPDPDGPEELDCRICGGTGYVERWEPLEKLLGRYSNVVQPANAASGYRSDSY